MSIVPATWSELKTGGWAAVKAEPLSQDEYLRLRAALPAHRYILLAQVLRNTGLREAEVLRVCPDHMIRQGNDHFIRIMRGKSKRRRWEDVALHPELGLALDQFAKGNAIRPGQPIFGFTARRFQQVFHEAALRGIGRPAHPHQLRHLYAKTMIDGGVPTGAVAKLLGHADERTTLAWYYDLTRDQRSVIARSMPV